MIQDAQIDNHSSNSGVDAPVSLFSILVIWWMNNESSGSRRIRVRDLVQGTVFWCCGVSVREGGRTTVSGLLHSVQQAEEIHVLIASCGKLL